MPDSKSVERIMHRIKNPLGVPDSVDVSRIQAILAKYDGRPNTNNALGISSFDEGRRASRRWLRALNAFDRSIGSIESSGTRGDSVRHDHFFTVGRRRVGVVGANSWG